MALRCFALVAAIAAAMQPAWSAFLVLPRTHRNRRGGPDAAALRFWQLEPAKLPDICRAWANDASDINKNGFTSHRHSGSWGLTQIFYCWEKFDFKV